MCVYIYIYTYTHTHTHACIYLRKICYVYILNIFIYDINYMNINICDEWGGAESRGKGARPVE